MNPTPSETLGISEQASYEEIQAARQKLSTEFAGDPAKLAAVEAAYDALLMQRLRLRQEGKIKVPDGVKQADKADRTPLLPPVPKFETPSWLQSWTEKPDPLSTFGPPVLYLTLGGLLLALPSAQMAQTLMAVATGGAFFFFYRKGSGLGRSVLLGFGGLILGFILGALIYGVLLRQIPGMPAADLVVSWILYLVLWLLTTFLK